MYTIWEVDKANSSLDCEEDKGFCSSLFWQLFGYKSPNCTFIHYCKDYQPEIYHHLAYKEIVGYPYVILMRSSEANVLFINLICICIYISCQCEVTEK